MYEYHHNQLPDIFIDFFKRNSDVHQYCTRQSDLLHIPKFRTELRKRSFRSKAVSIWNDTYNTLKSVEIVVSTFKDHMKKYLLSL